MENRPEERELEEEQHLQALVLEQVLDDLAGLTPGKGKELAAHCARRQEFVALLGGKRLAEPLMKKDSASHLLGQGIPFPEGLGILGGEPCDVGQRSRPDRGKR